MRVLYVSYPISSQQSPHQFMAALWLARAGVEIIFMSWGSSELSEDWQRQHPEIDYRLTRKKGVVSAVRFLVAVLRAIFQDRPDCLYIQGAQNTPFVLWLCAVRVRPRIVYHTQDYLEPGEHRLYEASERWFARRSDVVISNEPNRARFMSSSYRLSRIPEVIRTALPTWWAVPDRIRTVRDELLCRAHLDPYCGDSRLIVAGGPYARDRMSPQLVEAFGRLPDNYALVFTDMRGRPVEWSRELGRRIVCLDSLEYVELLRIYAACDVGVLLYPNSGIGHYYQAPGRLTEYLRCGVAVLTSNFPGFELLVCKYQVGKSVDPYDPVAIAEAIRAIGDVTEEEMERRRKRLKHIALSELSYDADAVQVFSRIFSVGSCR